MYHDDTFPKLWALIRYSIHVRAWFLPYVSSFFVCHCGFVDVYDIQNVTIVRDINCNKMQGLLKKISLKRAKSIVCPLLNVAWFVDEALLCL